MCFWPASACADFESDELTQGAQATQLFLSFLAAASVSGAAVLCVTGIPLVFSCPN